MVQAFPIYNDRNAVQSFDLKFLQISTIDQENTHSLEHLTRYFLKQRLLHLELEFTN
jgi:S-ribosylhomocysteine lyase LuxS involved in autoinducer biosynthesis